MNKKMYQLMNWPEIEAVTYGECKHPHDILGIHKAGKDYIIQAFFPEAVGVNVIMDKETIPMELVDETGFYAVLVKKSEGIHYSYQVEYSDGVKNQVLDPYYYTDFLKASELSLFEKGIQYDIYQYLGAHLETHSKTKGVKFALWAPNAVSVSVVGDFNHWNEKMHPMQFNDKYGIYELFLPGIGEGECYKYCIHMKGGQVCLKADPYAFSQELRPNTASVVTNLKGFNWEDDAFIKNRKTFQSVKAPINIYELYLGSFLRPREDENEEKNANVYLNYRDLAKPVIDYVKKMGYTHIELMPVMEHPLDNSWGYQVIGYYAPTSRYGSPKDFMYFVNECHKAGIGVILDWVPAHFPQDEYGLAKFDGTCLYEHIDPRRGRNPGWGTLMYNYARPQVSNYLISNALFWVNIYHADGIRMDAVASMLYLDYGRADGEWIANEYGGNENYESVEFIKHVNSILSRKYPGVIKIAEESTAWPKVTGSLRENGLGFDFKWNMGWMNDLLGYLKYDPYFRSYHHSELTFSMIYAYTEQFMLVFSHDEVVHGKSSMIGKMPGSREEKFMNLRAAYAYMMMHPGKKLLFMGQDIGEFEEWNENRAVKWDLLNYDGHKQLNLMCKELNDFYRKHPALFEYDNSPKGFEWINNISANESILVFIRKADISEETLLVVANFANCERKNYRIGAPFAGKYREVFSTDDESYGGTGFINPRAIATKEEECDGRSQSLLVKVAPLSVAVYSYRPFNEKELKQIEERKILAEKKEKERLEKIRLIKEEKRRVEKEKERIIANAIKEAERKQKELDKELYE